MSCCLCIFAITLCAASVQNKTQGPRRARRNTKHRFSLCGPVSHLKGMQCLFRSRGTQPRFMQTKFHNEVEIPFSGTNIALSPEPLGLQTGSFDCRSHLKKTVVHMNVTCFSQRTFTTSGIVRGARCPSLPNVKFLCLDVMCHAETGTHYVVLQRFVRFACRMLCTQCLRSDNADM
jgi:hypothetical protein